MESSTSPDAKRARKSTRLHQSFSHKREVDATKQSSSSSSSSPRESALADQTTQPWWLSRAP
ncbi:unnamed protein product [Pylaiella littoralis]